MRHILRGIFLLIVAILSASGMAIQSQVEFGKYSYAVPSGWKSSATSKILTLVPEDSSLKGARIEIFVDEALVGTFDSWFDRKWDVLRAGRTIQQTTPLVKKSESGFTAYSRNAIYSQTQLELVFAFLINGRVLSTRSQIASVDQADLVQQAVIAALDPAIIKASGAPTSEPKKSPITTKPPEEHPKGSGQEKTERVNIDGLKVPTNAQMPPGSLAQSAHQLASMYLTDPVRGYEALTVAIRASGFSIWSASHKPIAQPLTKVRAGIAFNEDELAIYYAMSRGGVLVQFGKFSDAFQSAGLLLTPSWSWTSAMTDMMREGLATSDPGKHFYALFLSEVFKQSGGFSIMRQEQWGQAHVDPMVMLLLFHPMTEMVRFDLAHIANGLNQLKRSGKIKVELFHDQVFLNQDLWASNHPLGGLFSVGLPTVQDPQAPAPGWLEDGLTGTLNNANGLLADKAVNSFIKAVERAEGSVPDAIKSPADVGEVGELFKRLEKLGKMQEFLGNIGPFVNFISSISKFITTYAALDATFDIIPEKEPLIRTKSRSPGEQRDVKVTLQTDSSKLQNVMKTIRPFLAPFGIDLDQPPSGPMAGAEVTWRMMGDTQSHSIWFKGDYVRRSTTDENGSATVTVEGRPQDTDLTKYKLQPFIRRESVGVTIAVKKAEIKQDMVDAVFGGLGILTLGVGPESNVSLLTFGGAKKGVTGGGAILGPIMEMLYRTDWAYKGFKMNVQDWRGEAMLLDLNINVEGRGVVKSGGHLKKVRVNHSVYFVDGLSQESVVLYPTGQMMTNADSTRLLGGKSATTNMYSTKFPARLGYDIDDRWDWKGMKYGGDCLNPTQRPVDDWKTWTAPVRPGAGYPPIQMGIEIKTAQNKDGVKAWIVTNNFPAIIFEGNSQLPSRITSTMFYAGSTMEKWIRELPIDISSVESRTYKGIGNDPDFLILEASGVETKSDVWFETLGVVGRATWKVTRIIASDPSQLAVINGLNLSRSTIRQSLNTLTAVSGPVRASRQK